MKDRYNAPATIQQHPVIQLSFTYRETAGNPDTDTIFYAPDRKLQWNDFRGTPSPAGPSAAVAYTSFAYEGSSRLVHDTLRITLQLQVFFIKSASWVRTDAQSNYALAHEQLHFDITRLVVERFRQKLQQTALNRDDYDSIIQYQYLQSFREMNRLQYQFDQETRHGLDPAAQTRWRDKINVGMKNNGVLPEELGFDFIEDLRFR
ncbi:hypothetical protein [Chitinophaga nivalis]|uniref:DUF922 domain-containing protein n=1 Tax=Chitinophaga nivalis TaxID=2991709 RepID=A0ABT3IVJ8_9BACT|nr:hypothetical protein [Chitinophaga nivalis]MCW3462383.1 hypothetical protein [Chitinophaga nivalis]MCW3487926.1 hypothetical protein [Chitinophaga nivalis]